MRITAVYFKFCYFFIFAYLERIMFIIFKIFQKVVLNTFFICFSHNLWIAFLIFVALYVSSLPSLIFCVLIFLLRTYGRKPDFAGLMKIAVQMRSKTFFDNFSCIIASHNFSVIHFRLHLTFFTAIFWWSGVNFLFARFFKMIYHVTQIRSNVFKILLYC